MEFNDRGRQNLREAVSDFTKAVVSGLLGGALALLLFYIASDYLLPSSPALSKPPVQVPARSTTV